MENIIVILKGIKGVFFNISDMNCYLNSDKDGNIPYKGIEHDKRNLRNDMLRLFNDFNTATKEAKRKKQPVWQ